MGKCGRKIFLKNTHDLYLQRGADVFRMNSWIDVRIQEIRANSTNKNTNTGATQAQSYDGTRLHFEKKSQIWMLKKQCFLNGNRDTENPNNLLCKMALTKNSLKENYVEIIFDCMFEHGFHSLRLVDTLSFFILVSGYLWYWIWHHVYLILFKSFWI